MATITQNDVNSGNYPGGFNDPNVQFSQSFLNPELAQSLSSTLGGVANQAAGNYFNVVNNPTQSAPYQNALAGILNDPLLKQRRDALNQNLQDQFRAAGNMSSSIFGNAAANQNTQFLAQDQSLASQLLQQLYPQMLQAYQQPMSQVPSLLSALKLAQQKGTQQDAGGYPPGSIVDAATGKVLGSGSGGSGGAGGAGGGSSFLGGGSTVPRGGSSFLGLGNAAEEMALLNSLNPGNGPGSAWSAASDPQAIEFRKQEQAWIDKALSDYAKSSTGASYYGPGNGGAITGSSLDGNNQSFGNDWVQTFSQDLFGE